MDCHESFRGPPSLPFPITKPDLTEMRFLVFKMQSLNLLSTLALTIALVSPIGCRREASTSGQPSTADAAIGATEAVPDDVDKVAALEAGGFQFKKDSAGVVRSGAFFTNEPPGDLLQNLVGVPNIQAIVMSGPGITDEGMNVLAER